MAIISTNVYGDIDLKSYEYRYTLGSDSNTYAYVFSTDKGNFMFVPDDVIAKGFIDKTTNYQWYSPQFLNQDYLTNLYTKYQPVDFGGFNGFDYSPDFYWRLEDMGYGSSGILIPEGQFNPTFHYYNPQTHKQGQVKVGPIEGIGKRGNQLVYVAESKGPGNESAWLQSDGRLYAQWEKDLDWFQKAAKDIAKIPLFAELTTLAVTAAGGAQYAPYIYGALKGMQLGAQGVDPLTGGLMVGVNLAAQGLASDLDFAKSIGSNFGATDSAMQLAIGKAVIGAGVNGIRASLAGQDVTKAMLDGALTAGASSTVAELSRSVLGPESQKILTDLSKSTGLTSPQLQTIVASSFVSGIVSEMKGGNFSDTFKNSLVGAGVSQAAANQIGNNLPSNISEETRKAIVTGTASVAGTAAVAMLNGQDISQALENNLPSIIYSTMNSYNEQVKKETDAKKAGWSNYTEQLAAQAKYGNIITPSEYKAREQFIEDAKEFTFDASKANSIPEARQQAVAAGFNTFLGPDKKIYTIGGQSLSSMDTFVQAMNPKFDPEAYKRVNKLGAEVNAAEHYLDVGQYKNLPVNYEQYVDKTFSSLPEYQPTSAKDFYREERDAAINAARSGDFNKVDQIAKAINKSFTTNEEAAKFLKDAYSAVGLPNKQPTQQELDLIRGKNEVSAYTIAQAVSAMGATTFDGTKYANPKLAEQAAKSAGYNTFQANDGNTYRVMSAIDEANIRANIEEKPTFKDAFALARAQLGDGKTFLWNGKQYTTNILPADTFDASRSGSLESAATLAYANGKNKFIGPDGKSYTLTAEARSALENAVNQSPAETARLLRQAVTPQQDEYLAETQRLMEKPGRSTMDNISAMTSQLLGTTQRGIGEFLTNAGKTYAAVTNDKSFDNALTRLGKEIENYAKQSDVYGLDVQKNRISQAIGLSGQTDNWWEKTKIIGDAIARNPLGFFDIAGSEVIQEIPETAIQIGIALSSGGAGLPAIAAVSGAGTFLESFGNSAESAYLQAKARGDSDEVANNKAYINATVSTLLEIGPEIIADKALVAPFVKSIGDSLINATGRFAGSVAAGSASEFVSSLSQSYAEQVIVDPAKANFSKAVTDGIFGMYIGGAAQGALSVPGYAIQSGAIIGKDYNGSDVSISDIINGTKTLDSSTVNPNTVIGRTNNNNEITLGGALTSMPSYNFNEDILSTYVPTVFSNNNLVVGKDALGNNVTYGTLLNQVTPDKSYADVFNAVANPTEQTKINAQKIYLTDQFKAIGYTPTENQINSLIVQNPGGSQELTNSAKITAFTELAKEQNYELTPDDIKIITEEKSPIQNVEQFKAYVDPLGVTAEEARRFYESYGYTTPTEEQVSQLIGLSERDAIEKAVQIADPFFFDIQEIKSIAQSEGFTISDEEAAKLVRETKEAEAEAAFRAQIDPLATIQSEAEQFFNIFGYTPEPDELSQFILSKPESEIKTSIEQYVDPRQVTEQEAQKFFETFGYTPTAQELAEFTRQGRDIQQQQVQSEIETYVDPRTVTEQEVRQAFEQQGIKTPISTDITRFVGQYPEEELTAKVEGYLPTAKLNIALEEQERLRQELEKIKEQEKAQAEEARRRSLLKTASEALAPTAATAAAAAGIEDIHEWKKPFITSTMKQEEFKGPLEEFQEEVEKSSYLEPFPEETPEMKKFMGVEPEKEEQPMPDYFTYGQQTDIDQLFNPFGPQSATLSEFDSFSAASGGLVPPLMAGGGLTRYAGGGLPVVEHSGKARLDFRRGAAVSGPGDGQSDDIPAMLADGEFVIPADVVAALGNGSTKAGSDKLYKMMHSIRSHHRAAKPKDLPPPAKASPLDYLKKSRS